MFLGCTAPSGKLLRVEADAASLGVTVAYTLAWGEPPESGASRELLRWAEGRVRSQWGNPERLTSDPVVQAYRQFYWRIGVDPTKTRPSGEALARRILRGKSLPEIHPVVDVGNAVSAVTLVPIGIYDLDRARPPFTLRLSRGGEEFHPIGGEPRRLPAGVPILVDSEGKVMHVYPYRDSRLTCVNEDTRRVLIVAAGVPGVPRRRVAAAARMVASLLTRLGWTALASTIVEPESP